METFLKTLRLALRSCWRQPLISTAVVLCLGVGIGITAVVYSLISGILLRPLPYPEPDNIFMLWNRFPANGVPQAPASGWEYLDFREQTQTFEEVGGVITWPYNVTNIEPPERIFGGRVSASLFRVLGIRPALGRVFDDDEEQRGDRLVVLSHGFWQRAFGGDPNVLGRTVSLSEQPYTVIGVMPQDLRPIPLLAEIWVPLVPNPNVPRDRRGVMIVTRLQDGVDAQRADSDLKVLEDRFRQDYPELYPPESGWGLFLQPLHEAFVGDTGGRLWVSFGAVLLVLLLACANIANLLLVRALSRRKEYALRTALGASRGNLLRQLVGENLVLALAGGLLGWWLAQIVLNLLVAIQPGDMLRLDEVSIDGGVLLFIFVLTLIVGLIFGLYPAWRIAGQNLRAPLNDGSRTSVGPGHPLFRWIVVAEMTIAVVVLVGTGLMWLSFQTLQNTNPGFRTTHLLTMIVQLPRSGYRQSSAQLQFYNQLEQGLTARFGEDRFGLVSRIPLGMQGMSGAIQAEHQQKNPSLVNPEVGWRMISPSFFKVMGISLVQGRAFDARDHEETAAVVIIDSKVANRLWPGENPLGKRLRLDLTSDQTWRTVVGVVEPIKQRKLAADTSEQIYMPYAQVPHDNFGIILRSDGDQVRLVEAVREIVRPIDPYLPISNIETIEQLVSKSLSGPRFLLTLFTLFGVIALILTAAGIYGIIAYTTARRTGEIGLRQAVGARRADIFWLILQQGLRVASLGIALGLGIAYACAFLLAVPLASMAFGVSSTHLGIFAGVGAALLLLAMIASFLPALRAAKLDPAVALMRD